MANRYFFEPRGEGLVAVTGEDAAHLTRVLRTAPGDTLPLADGHGRAFGGEVAAIEGGEVLLRLTGEEESRAEPQLWVQSAIAWAKGDKLDWAVQKCVEAGASEIVLFAAERSVALPKQEEKRLARLERIAREAAKQSGRIRLPALRAAPGLAEALAGASGLGARLVFHPAAGAATLQGALQGAESAAFFTGPESGFSDRELALAREAGARLVGLGPRVLRCETAPVVALAAAMALRGELE